jgi:glycosyltransferase involved in cell wall biosynthesis
MKLSVVICTHNPNEAYLRRVLSSLEQQTLPREDWEFLLIDNASAEPLSAKYDLSWQPHGRHVVEAELGLTPARLRGIRESATGVIVFVDDDNVLAPDYLELAWKIGQDKPWLGAWGGSIKAEYEKDPGDWFKAYEMAIAVREVSREFWSNDQKVASYGPIGAGLIVRKHVAEAYAEKITSDPLRKGLGRKGGSLMGGEDLDLVLMACDLGLGKGVFPELKLLHLIAARRTDPAYLWRLVEGSAQSFALLHLARGEKFYPPRELSFLSRCNQWRFKRKQPWHERAYQEAWERGLRIGWQTWHSLQAKSS